MNYVLPVASGKGGVGKTLFSANLGLALAALGKTVVVVDLDLGASNLHTVLGIRNNNPGVGNLIYKQAETLEALIVPTDYPRLYFVPGDNLLPGTANLPYFQKRRLMRQLDSAVADFIILDLGSGSAFNTIDFYLMSSAGLIVTTPETTSILNAYSFLKTTLYRALYRSFPKDSPQRELIRSFVLERLEGAERGFDWLVGRIAAIDSNSASLAQKQLGSLVPRVVLNMGRRPDDVQLGGKLRQVSRKNLNLELQYIGYLPYEESVAQSILNRRPIYATNPALGYCRNVAAIAQKLAAEPVPVVPRLHLDDDDLAGLARQAHG